MMQVFLAKRKIDGKYYAIKVLQKKVILNRKEVVILLSMIFVWCELNSNKWSFSLAKTHHGRAQRAAEERETPFPGGAPLLFPDNRQVILRLGLHQWRRSESSEQEVKEQLRVAETLLICSQPLSWVPPSVMVVAMCVQWMKIVFYFLAFLPSSKGAHLSWAQSKVLHCWNGKCTGIPALP